MLSLGLFFSSLLCECSLPGVRRPLDAMLSRRPRLGRVHHPRHPPLVWATRASRLWVRQPRCLGRATAVFGAGSLAPSPLEAAHNPDIDRPLTAPSSPRPRRACVTLQGTKALCLSHTIETSCDHAAPRLHANHPPRTSRPLSKVTRSNRRVRRPPLTIATPQRGLRTRGRRDVRPAGARRFFMRCARGA